MALLTFWLVEALAVNPWLSNFQLMSANASINTAMASGQDGLSDGSACVFVRSWNSRELWKRDHHERSSGDRFCGWGGQRNLPTLMQSVKRASRK
jgi:hypothetical protein